MAVSLYVLAYDEAQTIAVFQAERAASVLI